MVVRLPERDLAESILDLAAPLLEPLGTTPPLDEARRAIVEHHRGVVGGDGVATVYAKMPTVVQLFAEGRLPPIGGPPVDVTIGGRKLGAMVLTEVHCAGDFGRNDVAALVFRAADAGAA